MLEDHWLGVCRWHPSACRLLEGLNSLIQAAKRRARGYRTNRNYTAVIYLVAGKLNAVRRLPGCAPDSPLRSATGQRTPTLGALATGRPVDR